MEYGKLVTYEKNGSEVTLAFEKQSVIITAIKEDIINFFVPVWSQEHCSKAIEGDKSVPTEVRVEETADGLIIATSHLTVEIADGFRTKVYDRKGALLMEDYEGERIGTSDISEEDLAILAAEGHSVAGYGKEASKVFTAKKLDGDLNFYGLGDKSGFLNKRAYAYENWNSDIPQTHTEDYRALYKSIPFLICHKKEQVYGLFFDNTFRSQLNLGKESEEYFYYSAQDGNLDYYFLAGDTMAEVIGNYTYLTGTTPLPQLWTLGYHQCRWGYECAEDIREVAHKYRELAIPCESVQYDIDYMEQFKVFTWNEARYGARGALFEELGELGFKPVVIIDPGVKQEKGYSIYDQGVKEGYFATDEAGEIYVNEVWPGDAVYPDFGRRQVRDWWGENHRFLTDMGVRGVWNDMNEPASFRGELPMNVVFHDGERKTTHAEIHNVYGHYMGKATYDGLRKLTDQRPFVITRACYAGSQKYSAVWTGDNQSIWAHLQMLIPQICNLGMSGFSLAGVDIGGFGADTTPELLCRWIEAAVFSPFFRNHSAKGTRRQEPWQFGAETVDIYRKYVEIHYRFLPYLYDLFYQGEKSGLPVMRPLVLHYEKDPETFCLNSEFLVGENILVAPVLEQGATRRMVYLPEGTWYDYWTGAAVQGGQYILREAPLAVCPMYIRGGSVIPTYETVQYVGEKPYNQLILLTTPEGGSCEHFKDDGEGYGYKEGSYNLYRFCVPAGTHTCQQEVLHKGYADYEQIRVVHVGEQEGI